MSASPFELHLADAIPAPFRTGFRISGKLSDALNTRWSVAWDTPPTFSLATTTPSCAVRIQRAGSSSSFGARVDGFSAEVTVAPFHHRGWALLTKQHFVAGLSLHDYAVAPVVGLRYPRWSVVVAPGVPGCLSIRVPHFGLSGDLHATRVGWQTHCRWEHGPAAVSVTASQSARDVFATVSVGAMDLEAIVGNQLGAGVAFFASPALKIRAGLVRKDRTWGNRVFVTWS